MYDATPNFDAQARLLKPGGAMVHNIDLRDYGMFSKYGFHPLEFLTVPDWQYRLMVERSGQPGRRMVDYYRDTARQLGFESEIYITRVLGREHEIPEYKTSLVKSVDYSDEDLARVGKIRPRFQPQFRLSDQDLFVQSIVFVARKPAASL